MEKYKKYVFLIIAFIISIGILFSASKITDYLNFNKIINNPSSINTDVIEVSLDSVTKVLGFSLSIEDSMKKTFKCNAKRLPTPEKNAFFWQNVCEGHDSAYVGIFWKRLDYQKLTFQNGVFNEFMKNWSKQSGQNVSGQFICEESSEYNPNKDKTKMRTVVVSCINKFVNSTTTLYANFIYSYPVEATVLNASPVIVVSSQFSDITKISTKNIVDNLHKVKKVNNPISLLFNPMHAYASAGAGAAGDGTGAGTGSCGPGADAGSCGPGADSGTSGTGDSSGGDNGGNGGDGNIFFGSPPAPSCPNGATDYPSCSACPDGQLFSGGVCQNQTWTSYCTGPSDPNPWQVWQYDNGDSRGYRFTGGYCQPTGSLSISSPSCIIAIGASSCTVNATWNTTYPFGTSAVTRNNPNRTDYTANDGGPSPITIYGSTMPTATNIYLYNTAILLDTKSASATCAVGGWDSISGMCVNPLVTSVTITGQYYSSPGTISFTCSGSNNYTVRNTDTNAIVATGVYSGPRSVSVGPTGNYGVVCGYGNYLSDATVRYYNAPPPPLPVVSLISSPRTLVRDAQTTLTWDIQWPVNACTFTAESVCTNGICNATQLSSEAALTTKLRTESTDTSDPSGVRTINSSMRTIAPGHIDTDWKALGRKTVNIANTMDITIDCGSSRSATTRVQVTSSNEQ